MTKKKVVLVIKNLETEFLNIVTVIFNQLNIKK
jgi:hypothetical protein